MNNQSEQQVPEIQPQLRKKRPYTRKKPTESKNATEPAKFMEVEVEPPEKRPKFKDVVGSAATNIPTQTDVHSVVSRTEILEQLNKSLAERTAEQSRSISASLAERDAAQSKQIADLLAETSASLAERNKADLAMLRTHIADELLTSLSTDIKDYIKTQFTSKIPEPAAPTPVIPEVFADEIAKSNEFVWGHHPHRYY